MKKYILLLFFGILSTLINAQSLPANRYYASTYLLDDTSQSPSFAYSLRKLKSSYTGFAIRVRRSADNAEANVSFDANDIVSTSSNVTITAIGTSSLTVGQVLTYSTFVGSSTIYVNRWYDQGTNAYHANQTTNALQPTLVLNSAGFSNTQPSILFNGTATNANFLDVGQPIQNITNAGINGSFLLVTKPTQNVSQLSFGTSYVSSAWRWAIHLNWNDSYCYFDAAENCCATNRRFSNPSNINKYKQYSFVRGASYKTVRINTVATALNNSLAASTSKTGGSFYIGFWSAAPSSDNGYFGNVSEVIMFPTDLSATQLSPIEYNQIQYWGL